MALPFLDRLLIVGEEFAKHRFLKQNLSTLRCVSQPLKIEDVFLMEDTLLTSTVIVLYARLYVVNSF